MPEKNVSIFLSAKDFNLALFELQSKGFLMKKYLRVGFQQNRTRERERERVCVCVFTCMRVSVCVRASVFEKQSEGVEG